MRSVEKTFILHTPERFVQHGLVISAVGLAISAQSPDLAVLATALGLPLMVPGMFEMCLDWKTYFKDIRGRNRIRPSRIAY
jgi:hypothetical protein